MPIFSQMAGGKFYERTVKPVFDCFGAIILLITLSPLLLITGITLWIHFGRPPIFVQHRIGRQEKVFKLLKFRTMKVDNEGQSVTGFGKFLRSVSVDELPQLLNIIRGDMSFIGPRPLLVEYLPFYNKEEKQRHLVKPGITGWAQVNGRSTIGWDRRMQLDLFYVRHISFKLDLRILIFTLRQLFKRDMTSYKGEETIKFSEYASKR